MITGESLDRRFWIGASDTKMVMSKDHEGDNWKKWWGIKTGFLESGQHFSTKYTVAGDIYEKPIVRAFEADVVEDRTILLPEYSLRVNLDADIPGEKIIEAKTYMISNGKMDVRSQTYKNYCYQIHVQQFAWWVKFGEKIDAEMRTYYLKPEDYESAQRGIALPLDYDRFDRHEIKYDATCELWLENYYLPRLKPLGESLRRLRDAIENKSD